MNSGCVKLRGGPRGGLYDYIVTIICLYDQTTIVGDNLA
jgi:hypothetical protein